MNKEKIKTDLNRTGMSSYFSSGPAILNISRAIYDIENKLIVHLNKKISQRIINYDNFVFPLREELKNVR